MGLDNGIELCIKDKRNDKVIAWYEICYWRKCWSIRDEILDSIKNRDADGWRFIIYDSRNADNIDLLFDIQGIINKFLSQSYITNHNRSIWHDEELLGINQDNAENLQLFIDKIMKIDISQPLNQFIEKVTKYGFQYQECDKSENIIDINTNYYFVLEFYDSY